MVLEYIILALALLLVVAVIVWLVINEKQVLINWLVKAVTEAEKELGSGTGRLKLLYVYEKFLLQFKFVSRFLPFEIFSKLVDEALKLMADLLKNNRIAEYVNGDIVVERKVLNE